MDSPELGRRKGDVLVRVGARVAAMLGLRVCPFGTQVGLERSRRNASQLPIEYLCVCAPAILLKGRLAEIFRTVQPSEVVEEGGVADVAWGRARTFISRQVPDMVSAVVPVPVRVLCGKMSL